MIYSLLFLPVVGIEPATSRWLYILINTYIHIRKYRDEKTQSIALMIFFIELFANVKGISFLTFISDEKVLKHSIPVSSILFQFSEM